MEKQYYPNKLKLEYYDYEYDQEPDGQPNEQPYPTLKIYLI